MAHIHRSDHPCCDGQVAAVARLSPPPAPSSSSVVPSDTSTATSPSPHCTAEHCGPSHTVSVSPPPPASPPSPQKRPPSELELKVREIQKSTATSDEKGAQIHALFAAQRELASAVQRRSVEVRGVFPGASASRGCEHYSRNCWIQAACCGLYYPCRRCHDEAEDHEIDRRATKVVACVACGDAEQPVAESCRTCGIKFARYFCDPCRLYDDSPTTNAYHCKDCGICRVGKGLGIDNHHCDKCTTCVPLDSKDTHPCRERNLDSNCPICGYYLATSTDQTIFLHCSHPMHVSCLEKHMARSYVCPVCSKCIPDKSHMNAWYRKLDQRVALDRIPDGYQNRVSRVLCNDCETKTVARFHFQFHRCKDCLGYNTRVLHQYDVDPADLPPPIVVEPEATEQGANTEAQTVEAAVEQTVDASDEPPPNQSRSTHVSETDAAAKTDLHLS